MKSIEDLDLENQNQYISQFISFCQKSGDDDIEDSLIYNNQISNKSQILLPSEKYPARTSGANSTVKSEIESQNRRKIGSAATAKYRQKKKKYVQQLEETVKSLDTQIQETDHQIQQAKDEILKKLQSLAKLKLQSNDNSQIYNQLEILVNQAKDQGYIADIDKVNLLIDTLKYRIGPTGRQRQAKIDYHFKNIINTLHPALHRYLMKSATSQLDLFGHNQQQKIEWTEPLFKQIQVTPEQKQAIQKFGPSLKELYQHSQKSINRLYQIKKQLKDKQIDVQNVQEDMRSNLTVLQSAQWILQCQKYKYKRECFLEFDKNNRKYVQDYIFELEDKQLGACRKLVKKSY